MNVSETITSQPFDDRADAYRKSGDLATAIAHSHCGIEVDETTQERWRQLMGLMREVDTWADDTDVEPGEVIDSLIDFSLFEERYPALAPGALDKDARDNLVGRAARILKVGQWAAKEQSIKRFMTLRVIEARETVNMFDDVATPEVVEQPAFREDFIPTLRALGEAATLWDSLIDGRKDVREGKQALKPNTEYYARLTGAMLRRVKLGGGALLHVEPNIQVGIKVGQRIRNRIRNGITPYSSLQLLRINRSGK
jgi:hypothetical protein